MIRTVLAAAVAMGAGAAHPAAPARQELTAAAGTILPDARAPRCPTRPAPAVAVTDTPWPQRWFDIAALSRIGDGRGVTVAVIDSGVDAAHPQLAGSVLPGRDMLDTAGDGRTDCVGHGTAVASIIAARPRTGNGLRGLAPGVRILPIRVSERVQTDAAVTGKGDVADLAAGIRAATASRPKPTVINLSISTTRDHPALRAAVAAALDADIVVVAAVGNRHEQGDPRPYPASYDGVLGVGAIGPDGLRVTSSQTGSYVDVVAPGDRVVCAVPGGGHQTYQGTSVAVPFVAAAAALVRARWPRLAQAEVVHRLLATADPAAGGRPSPEYGYGVLNPVRAVTEIVPPGDHLAHAAVAQAAIPPRPAVAHPSGRNGWVIATAAALALAAVGLAAVGAVAARGRRRRWRPGRIEPDH